jgi:hypothetical protein
MCELERRESRRSSAAFMQMQEQESIHDSIMCTDGRCECAITCCGDGVGFTSWSIRRSTNRVGCIRQVLYRERHR